MSFFGKYMKVNMEAKSLSDKEDSFIVAPPTSPTSGAFGQDVFGTSSTMKTLLLFLFVAVAAVYSQVPERCEAPQAFESKIGRLDTIRGFFLRAKVSYDARNMRTRVIEEVETREERDYYDVLYLHNTQPGKEYRFNLKTKQCETRALNTTFRRFEIPDFARPLGEFTVGTKGEPGEGVDVTLWGGRTEDGADWAGVFTLAGCVPVNDRYIRNATSFDNIDFYDVTLGIANASVFIPPHECMP
ncbi:Mammalian ependymin- protein 1 [Branchiostoma belcheri]|nr:Mammalian ependymin- protein 1 [Branchiostoma belcheri]